MGRSGYYSKRDGDDEFDRQEWEQAQQKRAPTAPALGGDPSQTHPVSLEEWRSKPWKYKGYPAFSRWMASSNDFFLVRRFEQLNVRVLLFMQDRISEKEELLLTIDTCAQQSPDEVGNSGSLRDDPRQDRKDLLLELSHLLREYNEYLSSYSTVRSWDNAQDYQIANVENWLGSNVGAIALPEQQFIKKGRDVIPVMSRHRSPLHRMFEKHGMFLKLGIFRRPPRPDQVASKTAFYYSLVGVERAVAATIVMVGMLLLLGPMWALQFVAGNLARLGVITAFVVVFTALLGATTLAKPFEVLAGTAA